MKGTYTHLSTPTEADGCDAFNGLVLFLECGKKYLGIFYALLKVGPILNKGFDDCPLLGGIWGVEGVVEDVAHEVVGHHNLSHRQFSSTNDYGPPKKNAYKVISRGSDDISALLDLRGVTEDVK